MPRPSEPQEAISVEQARALDERNWQEQERLRRVRNAGNPRKPKYHTIIRADGTREKHERGGCDRCSK